MLVPWKQQKQNFEDLVVCSEAAISHWHWNKDSFSQGEFKGRQLKKKVSYKTSLFFGEPRAFPFGRNAKLFSADYSILCCHFYPSRILLRSRLLGFWALKFPSLAAFVHGRLPSGDILLHSYPYPAVQTLPILPALTSVLISY